MAGLKSLGRLGGGASRASPAVSPREPSPIDRSIHPVRESDTPEPDVHEERPRVDGPPAKTLDDYDRMTPGAAAAFKDALVELVEERPFAARPLLPRTPAINNAAAPVEEVVGEVAETAEEVRAPDSRVGKVVTSHVARSRLPPGRSS